MRGGPSLAAAFLLLASWGAGAQPGGPVETVVRHLDASLAHRCKDAWALYSRAMQEHIRSEIRQRAITSGAPSGEESPEQARCWRNPKHRRLNQGVVRMQGDEAVVAVKWRGRISQSRWDIPGKLTDWTEEFKLVREGGAWKIDGPRPKDPKRPGSRLEAGEVRVRITPRPEAGRHQQFEASAISYMPREALDAVMQDPKAWAAALPSFKAIEPGERAGPVSRAQLAFAPPATPIPISVRLAGRPNHANAPFTSVLWQSEEELKAPIYMRGEWHLSAQADGTTSVKLLIVIDPRHWPGSATLFSSERMAGSLVDLETVAAALAPR